MFSNRFRIACALSALLLANAACALFSPASEKPTATGLNAATPVSTQASTEQVSPTTPAPPVSETALPTETPTLAASSTSTLPVGVFPTETPTLTPAPVFAEVMKETNCRSGPAANYDLLATFQTGAKLEVQARDLGGGFIVVKNPEKPDQSCYVLSNNVKLSGEIGGLPEYTPLPSPTAAPNFIATFKKFDQCKGDVFAQFVIENVGSLPFRSAYIKVTNSKNGEVAEQVLNAFDLVTGCVIARNIAPLEAGATGYLVSATFHTDPHGNKLKAVIQVCTEKSLKGTCVTTSMDIKP